jgi:hypothetical protein
MVDRTRLDEPDEVTDEMPDEIGDEISDEELTRLALAADPDAPIDEDAVPFGDRDPAAFPLLPDWYMPAPSLRRTPWRAVALLGIAATLVIGTIGGFCVTYGIPEFVWN